MQHRQVEAGELLGDGLPLLREGGRWVVAGALGGTSGWLRRFQTGFVRSYALSMLGGGVLILAAMLAVGLP